MKLRDFPIGLRLGLAFSLVITMAIISSALSLHQLSHIQTNLRDVVKGNNTSIALTHEMNEAIHVVLRSMRTLMLLEEETKIKECVEQIREARSKYDMARLKIQDMPIGSALRAHLTNVDEAGAIVRPLTNQVLELRLADQKTAALDLLITKQIPAAQQWQDLLAESVRKQEIDNEQKYEQAVEIYESARNETLATTAALLVLSACLGWLITRSITRPLKVACTVAERISEGDLTVDVHVEGRDEAAQLLGALATMEKKLTDTVSNVRYSAESVAAASLEIAQANTDLSQRTEEQAGSLQETVASMEQITSTVKRNAENAHQADELARTASAVAVRGGREVSQVVQTMKEIEESSKKIADIIAVIDSIAFQTNILALNAAVEAARAAEQGRGFAVVAGEVRNLAQRSAEAAKAIKTLIEDSVEKVGQGSALVDRAGKTMEEVVSSIMCAAEFMGQISMADSEQSKGVAQIDSAMEHIDQVTQCNAALVEEGAAAASSLSSQAQNLVRAVAVFRINTALAAQEDIPASRTSEKDAHMAPALRPWGGPARRALSRIEVAQAS